MRRVIRLMAAAALAVFASAASAYTPIAPGWDEFSYHTLGGIDAVAIRIVGIDPGHKRYGLAAVPLYEAVAKHLQSAGIAVISEQEARQRDDSALVLLNFRHVYAYPGYLSYAVSLQVKQKIALTNRPGAFTSETVWSDGWNGWLLPWELPRVNQYVADLVSHFIADHRSQNANRPS